MDDDNNAVYAALIQQAESAEEAVAQAEKRIISYRNSIEFAEKAIENGKAYAARFRELARQEALLGVADQQGRDDPLDHLVKVAEQTGHGMSMSLSGLSQRVAAQGEQTSIQNKPHEEDLGIPVDPMALMNG